MSSAPTPIDQENPLKGLFRKPKLNIGLPSRGKWYPAGTLELNSEGKVSIYALTATDDIKLKTGDPTLTGKSIYDVIQSCCPAIKDASIIPHIDMETLLLAIKVASYGETLEFVVSVPNTRLTRTIKMNSNDLFAQMNNIEWDDVLEVKDNEKTSIAKIRPVSMAEVFTATRALMAQNKMLTSAIGGTEIVDEEVFSSATAIIANSSIDMVCDSIIELVIQRASDDSIICKLDSSLPDDKQRIKHILKSCDVEYYNVFKDHIESQKEKYVFKSGIMQSTEQEKMAGAPEEWEATFTLIGSNFNTEK
jgi:hypothetical protein